MDGNHPKNIDPRPKRRKDRDNPYEIFTTGINTACPHFYLSFKDSSGAKQCMEIGKTLFDAFDGFELDDLSFMNEVDRHYEQSDQTEQSLNRRANLSDFHVEKIDDEWLIVEEYTAHPCDYMRYICTGDKSFTPLTM